MTTYENWSLWITGSGVIVGIAVLIVYYFQLRAMRASLTLATSPRLYIESVSANRFEIGQSPVFLLRIRNSGPADALKIPVDIAIHLLNEKTAWYTGGDQIVTVPANGTIVHFIDSPFILNAETVKKISNDGDLLRVEGHVNHVRYCYKYNRGHKAIPELPMFIPCDFDTRRTVAARGSGGMGFRAKATATFDATVHKANDEESQPTQQSGDDEKS